jgi:spore coat polysaccharide biosynthesis predicted glycosyltransferase SpsG
LRGATLTTEALSKLISEAITVREALVLQVNKLILQVAKGQEITIEDLKKLKELI